MIKARKIFKGKLKWCQNHQDKIRLDLMASLHLTQTLRIFGNIHNNKLNATPSIHVSADNVANPDNIANIFKNQFAVYF